MAHDRSATPKSKATARYLGIEVDDALAIANKLMSEVAGQSRPALPAPADDWGSV